MSKSKGAMAVDELFKLLSHPVRRSMIRLLYERIEMSYSELLGKVGIDEGQFNFHLRLVRKLTQTREDGKYVLSPLGKGVYAMLLEAERQLGTDGPSIDQPILNRDLLLRRVAALMIDSSLFLISTGIFFDPFLWNTFWEFTSRLNEVVLLKPWVVHHLGELAFRTVSAYSNIFLAVFIALTLLDAYKGQTPGRYILGIRVVTVANRRLELVEAGVRNIGKVFLLPVDLLVGMLFFSRRGYIRFFDYYTGTKIEKARLRFSSQGIKTTSAGKDQPTGEL